MAGKAHAAPYDGSEKPIFYGSLKTRIIVEETVPLVSSKAGLSIGQLVDEYVENFRNKQRERVEEVLNSGNNPNELGREELFSLTIELPRED